MTESFVGIDISQNHLDVVMLPEEQSKRYTYDETGIKSLFKVLKKHRPTLIVMEATGGLEISLALGLCTKGLKRSRRWSILAKCVTMLGRWACWLKRIRLMRLFWRVLPGTYGRRFGSE